VGVLGADERYDSGWQYGDTGDVAEEILRTMWIFRVRKDRSGVK